MKRMIPDLVRQAEKEVVERFLQENPSIGTSRSNVPGTPSTGKSMSPVKVVRQELVGPEPPPETSPLPQNLPSEVDPIRFANPSAPVMGPAREAFSSGFEPSGHGHDVQVFWGDSVGLPVLKQPEQGRAPPSFPDGSVLDPDNPSALPLPNDYCVAGVGEDGLQLVLPDLAAGPGTASHEDTNVLLKVPPQALRKEANGLEPTLRRSGSPEISISTGLANVPGLISDMPDQFNLDLARDFEYAPGNDFWDGLL